MKLRGKDFILGYGNPEDTEYWVAFAYSTDCTVNISGDAIEVCARSDGQWRRYRRGRMNWSASASGVYSQYRLDTLMRLMEEAEPITVFLSFVPGGYIPSEPDGEFISDEIEDYVGQGIITSVAMGAPVNGIATYNISIQGSGKLNIK